MNSFNDHLARSAPEVSAPAGELDAEFARIIGAAERIASPPGRARRLRLVVGGLVAVGVVGSGTAAAAGVHRWWDAPSAQGTVSTSTGTQCVVTFYVVETPNPSDPVPAARSAQAVAAARAYLEALDVAALDVPASPAPAEQQTGTSLSVDQSEIMALTHAVGRDLEATLRQQGTWASTVTLTMHSQCDQ